MGRRVAFHRNKKYYRREFFTYILKGPGVSLMQIKTNRTLDNLIDNEARNRGTYQQNVTQRLGGGGGRGGGLIRKEKKRLSGTRTKETRHGRSLSRFPQHEATESTVTSQEAPVLPPGWDASPSQSYPPAVYHRRYPFIHLGGERQCGVKFLV